MPNLIRYNDYLCLLKPACHSSIMKFPVTFSLFALALSATTLQTSNDHSEIVSKYSEEYKNYLDDVFSKVYFDVVTDLNVGLSALAADQSFLSEDGDKVEPAWKQELFKKVSNSMLQYLAQANQEMVSSLESEMKAFWDEFGEMFEEREKEQKELTGEAQAERDELETKLEKLNNKLQTKLDEQSEDLQEYKDDQTEDLEDLKEDIKEVIEDLNQLN